MTEFIQQTLLIFSQVNWPDVFAGGFVGFISALLVAAIYEWARKPNLTFSIDPDEGRGQRKINGTDYKWKFMNILVENKKRPFYKSWLLGNVPVNNARAWVSFRDYETNDKIVKVNGRWASTKQPINQLGLDINEILIASRESIPVDEKASLAIAIKTGQSDEIFAFNNESYLYYPEYNSPNNTLWSKPEFRIGNEKRYRVCVEILSEGRLYKQEFHLINTKSNYDSIKLMEKQPGAC